MGCQVKVTLSSGATKNDARFFQSDQTKQKRTMRVGLSIVNTFDVIAALQGLYIVCQCRRTMNVPLQQ
jgi:hypothetical protein